MAVAKQHAAGMTVEDFYSSPWVPEKFVELVEGEVIQMTPAGWKHGDVADNIAAMFRAFCATRSNLHYCGEGRGFLVQRNPDSILSPDVALFRHRDRGPRPWMEFSPEIVVEILSPSSSPAEMAFKRHRYFEAGTEQFWLVDVEQEQIQFYHLDGRVVTVSGDEVFPGEGIAAGMQINLPVIFLTR